MTETDHLCGSIMQYSMEDFKLKLIFGPWLSYTSGLEVPLTLSPRKERPDIFCRVLSLITSGIKCLKKEGKPSALCMVEERERSKLSSCAN